MNPDILKSFVGNYTMDINKGEVQIQFEKDLPYVSFNHSNSQFQLYAESQDTFY
jgi:hypothetical protein